MSTTTPQYDSKVRPKRRSLGLSRKWQSPASAQTRINSSDQGFGLSPNTSNQVAVSWPVVINNESPKSALPATTTNATPNRLVSRYSNSRKRHFKATFKSPIKDIDIAVPNEELLEDVQKQILNLKKQIQLMEKEEDELRKCGFVEEELQLHIKKLHEYNELKDTGQMLIGKIATLESRTTREMYEEFGLDLED